jgi:patatin-related protein
MATTLETLPNQEIRVAAVLNGGVSLAVWMSGVVLELHHLGMASAELGEREWATYRQVLNVLRADARIDVVAGTSAGGLNGAFLALGIARQRDFAGLRDVWAQDGALDRLLRRPLEPNPPSALQGDGYFLKRIEQALATMAGPDGLSISDNETPPGSVELVLTGTLWSGRESTFTDQMGVAITERDYNATFRFTNSEDARGKAGHLGDPKTQPGKTDTVIGELARAARCTSSFPGAFEPHFVTAGADALEPGRWSSSAGQANFKESQYVIDGGVLLNKPIRPALDAIYAQPGGREVRRVLAYVVPDPGEAPPAASTTTSSATPDKPPVPVATDVVLGIMTRLRSTDSVSRELAEIHDTNAAVRTHQHARARLCRALDAAAETLAPALWTGYREQRIVGACSTIGDLIARGQPAGPQAWSPTEISRALEQVARINIDAFTFVPQDDFAVALAATGPEWHWGQTTVMRLGDMAMELLRRAISVPTESPADRARLADARAALGLQLAEMNADNAELNSYWMSLAKVAGFPRRTDPPVPPEGPEPPAAPELPAAAMPATPEPPTAPDPAERTAFQQLVDYLPARLAGWDEAGTGDPGASGAGAKRRAQLYARALQVAGTLAYVRAEIARARDLLLPPPGPDGTPAPLGEDAAGQLDALCGWLLNLPAGVAADPDPTDDPTTEAEAEAVFDALARPTLERMLVLDTVHVATAGALSVAEQEVELVQVSALDHTTITGMQLHHFGAFYRTSWRINDWITGRLDGARQVIRFLLAPERLCQCEYTPAGLLEKLAEIAAPAESPDAGWLAAQWELPANQDRYLGEITAALDPSSGIDALDQVSAVLALPLQLSALRADLPALAEAIRVEGADAPVASQAWLRTWDEKTRGGGQLSTQEVLDLAALMKTVGRQLITDDLGSDTFARTVSHAAVVATGAFTAPAAKLGRLKAVQLVLSSLRGYAAMVWVMVSYLTRGSVIGARIVQLGVAVGGVLLAVAVVVPGVPAALTAIGVMLLLAAASASALLTRHAFWMGVRLALAALLVLAVTGYPLVQKLHDDGYTGDVSSVVSKLLVGVGIVLLGWFIVLTGRGPALTNASVFGRGIALAVGTVTWTVGMLIVGAWSASRDAVVWNATAIPFEIALVGLLQIEWHRHVTGRSLWGRVPLIVQGIGVAGAIVSSCLDLTTADVHWLTVGLHWFLPIAMVGLLAAGVWTVIGRVWRGLPGFALLFAALLAGVAVLIATVPWTSLGVTSSWTPSWTEVAILLLVGFGVLSAALIVGRDVTDRPA